MAKSNNILKKEYAVQIASFYNDYSETIRPLLIEIEVLYKKFPISITNEIRMFNDHIARCYQNDVDDNFINANVSKSGTHIMRMKFDSYKYLCNAYSNQIDKFEKRTRYLDLTRIDNNNFYIKYLELVQNARNFEKKGKKSESRDKDESLKNFENAYLTYNEAIDLIHKNQTRIFIEKGRIWSKNTIAFIAWIISIIISATVTSIITCQEIRNSIIGWFR